jgi:hypothetical protein
VGAYVAINRYEHAMMALEAFLLRTTQVTVGTPFNPPGTGSPYVAMIAASVNNRTAKINDPDIMTFLLGQRSMNASAGSVITTLIIYCMEAEINALLPVSPAIWKMYTM